MLFSEMSWAYMGMFLGDAEHPDFRPLFNQAFRFGAPNPDDAYYLAPLAGDGVYRISGFRGTIRLVDFQIGGGAMYSRGDGPLPPTYANYDLDQLHIGRKDGSFEVILSTERPAGYQGDWWKLDARATHVLVRQISYDWLHEVDGRIAIERLDRPAIKPRTSAQEIKASLRQIPVWMENWTKATAAFPGRFKSQGLVNKAIVLDLGSLGGFAPGKQLYVEGVFEINPDEALIYETAVPKQCRYWNIQLTDMLYNVIDYTNRQSTLNGYTAKLDKDGKFRAVISATDPGVPNWLDNAGYAQGTLVGRWTECSSAPVPTISRIKLADVRKYLPADTPVVTAEERDASIRLRRKGAQLRRRW